MQRDRTCGCGVGSTARRADNCVARVGWGGQAQHAAALCTHAPDALPAADAFLPLPNEIATPITQCLQGVDHDGAEPAAITDPINRGRHQDVLRTPQHGRSHACSDFGRARRAQGMPWPWQQRRRTDAWSACRLVAAR